MRVLLTRGSAILTRFYLHIFDSHTRLKHTAAGCPAQRHRAHSRAISRIHTSRYLECTYHDILECTTHQVGPLHSALLSKLAADSLRRREDIVRGHRHGVEVRLVLSASALSHELYHLHRVGVERRWLHLCVCECVCGNECARSRAGVRARARLRTLC